MPPELILALTHLPSIYPSTHWFIHLSFPISIHSSNYPFIHTLSIHLSIHPSTHPSNYPSIYPLMHPSLYIYQPTIPPSIHLSTHLSLHPSTHPPNYPSIHTLSIHLSIHLSNYPSIHSSSYLSIHLWTHPCTPAFFYCDLDAFKYSCAESLVLSLVVLEGRKIGGVGAIEWV